jgi:hypothetical protein
MLTAEEVAPLLNTTGRWVYAHAEKLGGKHFIPGLPPLPRVSH